MRLHQLKLATRLYLGFGVMLFMLLASSGLALLKLAEVETRLEDVVQDNNVKIRLSHQMAGSVHVVARVMRTAVLVDDDKQRATEQAKLAAERAVYDKARAELEKFPLHGDQARGLRAAIDNAAQKARPLNDHFIELGSAGKRAEAVAHLLQAAAPATAAWQDALQANVESQEKDNAEQFAQAQVAYQSARNLLIGLALASALLAVGLVVTLVRGLLAQLGGEPAAVAALVNRIADADLDNDIPVRAGDSASVMAAMARMQQQLAGIVATVRSNADGVATASAQIAQGNQDLSSRTEQQASALQQTAATMEEVGATVRNTADNAKQANQLAQGASTIATQGGEVVGQVVDTMKGINDSSKKIADIIAVIDGIAFQTNILALNAAVEAARAGEQGRGFAVVASEVRSLAQRSADAAKEIKTLITASVERVEQGTELVDRAGQTMNEIVGSIRRVTDIVGEIASASVQQSSGVSQVGEAVGQMDRTTQQNAALVEESAAAAESLKNQAAQLVQAMAVFRIGSHGQAIAPRAVATAPATPVASRPATTPAAPARAVAASVAKPAAAPARPAAVAEPVAAGHEDWETF